MLLELVWGVSPQLGFPPKWGLEAEDCWQAWEQLWRIKPPCRPRTPCWVPPGVRLGSLSEGLGCGETPLDSLPF